MFETCQWIAGEPSEDDACKCGLPVEDDSPYCTGHLARIYAVEGDASAPGLEMASDARR